MEKLHSNFSRLQKAVIPVTFTQAQLDYISWYIATNRVDVNPDSKLSSDQIAAYSMWSSGQVALLKQLIAVNTLAAKQSRGG